MHSAVVFLSAFGIRYLFAHLRDQGCQDGWGWYEIL